MHPLRQRTDLPRQRTGDPTPEEVEQEWRRRAGRAEAAPEAAAAVRRQVAGHLDALARALGRPLRTALEIGCGTGRLTPTVAAHTERVLAVDMTEEMLVEARAACAGLGNVAFYRCAAQRLPLARSRMDVAVCVCVLTHVLDDAGFAAACRGIARSATHLVLVEPTDSVDPYARPRPLADYLAALPGARLVERGEVRHGDSVSCSALIALDEA
jgi:2-polyprenyl-3-methyl-5-hydroxy-6-metoxy-1,4-benzoquinol methylase